MMDNRYLILAGAEAEVAAVFDTVRAELPDGWQTRLRASGVCVCAPPETALVPFANNKGLLIGALYDKSGERIARLGQVEVKRALETRGRSLIERYWGRYAAVIAEGEAVHIVRDPSGSVPVYRAWHAGVRLFFSDVELPLGLGLLKAELDPEFMAHWLAFPFLRTTRTGLTAVTELPPGSAITLENGEERACTLWSPWDHASSDAQIECRAEAVDLVAEAVRTSVAAQGRHAGRILLELSGGLDSSLIATCLAGAGLPFDSINFASVAADGDERDYARISAAATGSPLFETIIASAGGGLELPPRRLRPGVDPPLRVIDRAFSDRARAIGADTLFSGTGGDNVFCYTSSAAPVLDALRDRGWRQARATAKDVADLCGVTLWTVARTAIRRRRRRCPALWRRNLDFLMRGIAPETPAPHPWLSPPQGLSGGKRDHVAALLRIQHVLDTPDRVQLLPVVYPLLSQPVVEACLRVPTWMWMTGGRNRALARDAFADDLPPEILGRRTKGRLRSFCHRSYLDHRGALLDLLLDGELQKRRLIDRGAVEAYLSQPGDPPDDRYFRISDLANLELWARSWNP